jgi:hypothetical protein
MDESRGRTPKRKTVMNRTLSLALAAAAVIVATSASHDASAAAGVPSCSTTADGFPVCVGFTDGSSGGGASTFLGAFAMPNGGWVEFYDDNDGQWWIEHNANGSVTIGGDEPGGGAKKKSGPSQKPNVPGAYTKQKRPVLAGVAVPAVKPSIVALKAAAEKQTASVASMTPSTQAIAPNARSRRVDLQLKGTGSCSGLVLVTKNGAFVSSTGITKVSFPSTRGVDLPASVGRYKIEFTGNTGCMNRKLSTEVTVMGAIRFPLPVRR